MTWQQYIYDIYRRLGMLEQRLTELSKSGQGRTKPALTPLDQVGMDVQTQLGNPPMTSVDTNGSAMQLDVNT
ncbi:MAG: hypothetical protein JSS66_05365 [Armatimonadetes bacterium]|nr:hypothetical protein [Armatimonadota bacterium]